MELRLLLLLCSFLALGSSSSLVHVYKVDTDLQQDDPMCEDCEKFLEDIVNTFVGPDIEEVTLEKIQHMCEQMPAKFREICENVAVDWVKNMFVFAHDHLNGHMICKAMRICHDGEEVETVLKTPVASEELKEGPMCGLCEIAASQASAIFADTKIRDEVESFAETLICTIAPETLRNTCKTEIQRLSDIVFDIVNTGLATADVCKIIGFCEPSGTVEKLKERIAHEMKALYKDYSPVLRHVYQQDWATISGHVTDGLKRMSPPSLVNLENQDGPLCGVCEAVIGPLSVFASDTKLKTEIEQLSEDILCLVFPEPLDQLCKESITEVVEIVFEFFNNQAVSGNICELLGLCGPAANDWPSLSETVNRVANDYLRIKEHIDELDWTPLEEAMNELKQVDDIEENVENSPLCNLCNGMMEPIESLASNEGFKNDIEDFTQELLCTYLPPPLRGMCKDEIARMTDLFFQMFDAKVVGQEFCVLIGLCTDAIERSAMQKVIVTGLTSLFSEETTKVEGQAIVTPQCTLCRELQSQFEGAMTNPNLKEDVEYFSDLIFCVLLPGKARTMCDNQVNHFIDAIFNILAIASDTGNFCEMIGLCYDSQDMSLHVEHETTALQPLSAVNTEESEKVGVTPQCLICRTVIGEFEGFFLSTTLKADIEFFSEILFCVLLPGKWREACNEQVIKFSDAIYDVIKNTMVDADTVCDVMGLCWDDLQAGAKHLPLLESTDLVTGTEPTQCALCKEIVGQVTLILTSKQLKADIDFLSETLVCTILPGKLNELCKDRIEDFTDAIFNLIKTTLDATSMCQMMQMCPIDNRTALESIPVASEPLPKQQPLALSSSPKTVKDSVQCDFCITVLGSMEGMFISPQFKSDIDFLTEQLFCNLMPGEMKDQCKSMMHLISDITYELLKTTLNATNFCNMIGMCEPSSLLQNEGKGLPKQTQRDIIRHVVPIIKSAVENSPSTVMDHVVKFVTKKYPHVKPVNQSSNDAACNVCRRVMDLVKQLMTDKQFESDVEEMSTELFCPVVPKSFQGLCKKEISSVTSMFFNIIDSEMDISALCEFFAMCESNGHLKRYLKERLAPVMDTLTSLAEEWHPTLSHLQSIKDEQGECPLCETVIKDFMKILEDDESHAKAVAAGQKYCKMMPADLAQQCSSFIQHTAGQILDRVISGFSPRTVCKAVGMCGHSNPIKSQKKDLMSILKEAPTEPRAEKRHYKPTPPPMVKVKKESRAPWCDICEEISTQINAFVGSMELERVAVSVGDTICVMMPTSLKYPCDTFVRNFFDFFLGDVSSFLTADFVCGVIGVCYVEFTPMNYAHSEFLEPSFDRD